MIITLSDGTTIEIVTINFSGLNFDWRRTGDGYSGVCMSTVESWNFADLTGQLTTVLESELITNLWLNIYLADGGLSAGILQK